MRQLTVLIAVLTCWLAYAPLSAQAAENYYVERGNPNANNSLCTEANPCSTISAAVTKAQTSAGGVVGDTIFVKNGSGPYTEGVTSNSSGTASGIFTIQNYPGHAPIIDGTGLARPAGNFAFCLGCNFTTPTQKISYVTIQGFEIRDFYHDGIKFSNADHLTFTQNYIHHNGARDGSTVQGNGSNGILGTGTVIVIDRNRIFHNGNFNGTNGLGSGHGLYITGSYYTITNNLIWDNANTGIQCAAYEVATTVRPSPAIDYSGWRHAFIDNNVFAYANPTRTEIGIVFWRTNSAGTGSSDLTLIHDVKLRNNIFFKAHIDFTSTTSSQAYVNFFIQNSVYYNNNPHNFITGGGSGTTYQLSNNCPTGPTGSCNTNPQMQNAPLTLPASPDYRLTSNSLVAINNGLNLTTDWTARGVPRVDYAGVARPGIGTNWERGAYEFDGSPPSDTMPPDPPTGVTVTKLEAR